MVPEIDSIEHKPIDRGENYGRLEERICSVIDRLDKLETTSLIRIETKLDKLIEPVAVWKWFMGIAGAAITGIIVYLTTQFRGDK